MIDYHLHGNFCGHGEGELEEYVISAIARGLVGIGFSAHLPKVKDPDPYHAMLEPRLPEYVALVGELQQKYSGRIDIRLGIEADYFPGLEEATSLLLSSHPFDYVIGAIHFLGDWHFSSKAGLDRYEEMDPREVFPAYFELVKRMIRTGLFDILAHPGSVMRSWFRPVSSMERYYHDIAELLREHGMAIEVNTAGLRRGADSIYPQQAFLEACAAAKVPVTLGSDAHRPSEVGKDFEHAREMIVRAGITGEATWKNRVMSLVPFGSGAEAPGML